MTRCETCGKPCQHRFCGFDCTVLHHTRSMPEPGVSIAHKNKIVFEAEDIKLLELAGLCLVDGPCSISGEPEPIRYRTDLAYPSKKGHSRGHEWLELKYCNTYEGRNPNMRLRGGSYSLGQTGE